MHDVRAALPSPLIDRLAEKVHDSDLLAEVEDLARTIAITRAELQRLDAGPFIAGHIPAATDELDEVVAHTASATNVILEVCERLEVAGESGQVVDAEFLQRATSQIYEACSFQDITGQRISKVVTTLKAIERKVGDILKVFGQGDEIGGDVEAAEGSLTNGPQLPGKAMGQADIDALMADF